MGFKIYTKAGDDGKTGLIGGERVSKHHIRVESYGTVDELNSHIGMIRCHLKGETEEILLAEVQNDLFTIGSFLASAAGSNISLPALGEEKIGRLESEIGSIQGAQAHVARCVCRRAERLVVHLRDIEDVPAFVVKYLNRLSDYLFTLARFLDHKNGGIEIIWKSEK
ncbi:MAG: hypothetical protein RIS28_1617 [Bacteroidota bacterium]